MKKVLALVLALSLVASASAEAQRPVALGVTSHSTPRVPATNAAALSSNSAMPSWVRWGLLGALGGAILFTVVDSNHSVGSRIISGAATGFVVVGGGVLLYDSVCAGSGPSAFCGR